MRSDVHIEENGGSTFENALEEEGRRGIRRTLADVEEAVIGDSST